MVNKATTTAATTDDEKVLLERLRSDCDVAFRNWAAQVRVLQSISSGDPQDDGAVQQARRWADEAAVVYREKRNLLVELLMRSQEASADPHAVSTNGNSAGSNGNNAGASQPVAEAAKDRSHQVEKIARQIWEESGRPAGSAEDDWYQAEEILDTRR